MRIVLLLACCLFLSACDDTETAPDKPAEHLSETLTHPDPAVQAQAQKMQRWVQEAGELRSRLEAEGKSPAEIEAAVSKLQDEQLRRDRSPY